MTYRLHRKMTPLLSKQLATQSERLACAGWIAYMFHIGAFHDDVFYTGTFYSNRFKK